jgi:hypothetical protein
MQRKRAAMYVTKAFRDALKAERNEKSDATPAKRTPVTGNEPSNINTAARDSPKAPGQKNLSPTHHLQESNQE